MEYNPKRGERWCGGGGERTYLLILRELGHVGGWSVVFEVTPDQVSGRQGRHQAELARQDGAADHPGQLGGVLSWRGK